MSSIPFRDITDPSIPFNENQAQPETELKGYEDQIREYVESCKAVYNDKNMDDASKVVRIDELRNSLRSIWRERDTATPPVIQPRRSFFLVRWINNIIDNHIWSFMIVFMLLTVVVAMEIATSIQIGVRRQNTSG